MLMTTLVFFFNVFYSNYLLFAYGNYIRQSYTIYLFWYSLIQSFKSFWIMVRTSYIINIDAKLLMTSSTNAHDELKNLHDEKKKPFTFAHLKKGWTLKENLKLVSSEEKGRGDRTEKESTGGGGRKEVLWGKRRENELRGGWTACMDLYTHSYT